MAEPHEVGDSYQMHFPLPLTKEKYSWFMTLEQTSFHTKFQYALQPALVYEIFCGATCTESPQIKNLDSYFFGAALHKGDSTPSGQG